MVLIVLIFYPNFMLSNFTVFYPNQALTKAKLTQIIEGNFVLGNSNLFKRILEGFDTFKAVFSQANGNIENRGTRLFLKLVVFVSVLTARRYF